MISWLFFKSTKVYTHKIFDLVAFDKSRFSQKNIISKSRIIFFPKEIFFRRTFRKLIYFEAFALQILIYIVNFYILNIFHSALVWYIELIHESFSLLKNMEEAIGKS